MPCKKMSKDVSIPTFTIQYLMESGQGLTSNAAVSQGIPKGIPLWPFGRFTRYGFCLFTLAALSNPYVLLRLRPQLNPERKFPLTKNELTAFVDKVMIILKDEVEQGYLTEQEYDDYVNLFRRAAENIFEKHADFGREVDRMTKPMIELPSVLQKRLYAEIDSLNANKEALIADNEILLADNETLTADNEALTADNETLTAELARMRALLEQYHIPVNA